MQFTVKINIKIFANPHFLFAIAWSICLLLYSLRWASVYPLLTAALFLFAVIAIVANTFFGLILQKISSSYKLVSKKVFNLKTLMIAISLTWVLNFLYSGVPLFNLLLGRDFDHMVAFGIPSLIIPLISFTAFLSTLSFYQFLKFHSKKNLYFFITSNLFFVLIFSRGTILLNILAAFLVWIFLQTRSISLGKILLIICSALFVLYLFGVAGNYRTISELKTTYGYDSEYDNHIILQIADASPSFRANLVPGEFMWSYLYLTSPLGNFQETIKETNVHLNADSFIGYVVNEFTPDFISKRLQSAFNIKKDNLVLFTPELSVPTTFAEAYLYLGWWGVIIYLIAMLLLPVIYFLLVRPFPLWQLGMTIMCCIYFFSIFDNMFIFSGLSLQLIYPFFFPEKNAAVGRFIKLKKV